MGADGAAPAPPKRTVRLSVVPVRSVRCAAEEARKSTERQGHHGADGAADLAEYVCNRFKHGIPSLGGLGALSLPT